MAALTAVTPIGAGVLNPGSAVAASDTISTNVLGTSGGILEIINGNASPDNVTISDNGVTPSGNALTGNTYAATVANGTSKAFRLYPGQANPATGLITITHSVTATVTYKLYKLD